MTKDYLALMQTALTNESETEALAVAEQAFDEQPENEQLQAAMCAILFEKKYHSLGLLLLFTERFPNSLHPMRVNIAQIMCDNFEFDNATSEARYFLRVVYDYNLIGQNKDERLKEHTSRAFLLSTSVYVGLGARSYAIRVLETASKFSNVIWQGHYKEEIDHLKKELEESDIATIDDKWESFWKTGAPYEDVYQICKDYKCEEMAIRVKLLHEAFEKDANYKLNENELMQVVLVNKEKEYLLG